MQYFSYSRSLLKLSIKTHHINLIEKFWGNCISFFPIKLTSQALNRCPVCPLLLTKLLCKLKSGLSGFGHQLPTFPLFCDPVNLIALSPSSQATAVGLEPRPEQEALCGAAGPGLHSAGQPGVPDSALQGPCENYSYLQKEKGWVPPPRGPLVAKSLLSMKELGGESDQLGLRPDSAPS